MDGGEKLVTPTLQGDGGMNPDGDGDEAWMQQWHLTTSNGDRQVGSPISISINITDERTLSPHPPSCATPFCSLRVE